MTEHVDDVPEAIINLAAKTLTGDIRDWLLERFRHRQKPWQQMTEDEQRIMASEAECAAEELVRKAVQIIAANGRTALTATLDQVVIKGGLKAVLTLSRYDEHRYELIDAQGTPVQIVVADAAPFEGERAEVQIDKDQPDLIEGAEDESDPVPDTVKAAQQIGYDHAMAGHSTKDGPPYPEGSEEADAWHFGSIRAQEALARYMNNETLTNLLVSDAKERIKARGENATAAPDHPADDVLEFLDEDAPEEPQAAEAAE